MMTRYIFIVVTSLLCFSCSSYAQNDLPCWVTGEYPNLLTKQEAMLKSYLLPMDLNDPIADAEVRIKNGDYRLIGVGGLGVSYLGLNMPSDSEMLCELGGRYLQGTGDVHESKSHDNLMKRFAEYAKQYNMKIIASYKAGKFK